MNKKLFEAIGANSMNPSLKNFIMGPDSKSPNAMSLHSGTSSTIPSHWNNSPFLSGGRLTSAFGANPTRKINKTFDYSEFLEISKKHTR